MESSGELLAPSVWSVYGKCAKTRIIVDWGAGCEVGAVIGHAGQPGHGFLHQKYNIFMVIAKAHPVYRCHRLNLSIEAQEAV